MIHHSSVIVHHSSLNPSSFNIHPLSHTYLFSSLVIATLYVHQSPFLFPVLGTLACFFRATLWSSRSFLRNLNTSSFSLIATGIDPLNVWSSTKITSTTKLHHPVHTLQKKNHNGWFSCCWFLTCLEETPHDRRDLHNKPRIILESNCRKKMNTRTETKSHRETWRKQTLDTPSFHLFPNSVHALKTPAKKICVKTRLLLLVDRRVHPVNTFYGNMQWTKTNLF